MKGLAPLSLLSAVVLAGGALLFASESRAQEYKPGDFFRDCDTFCPQMVVIPPGSFAMGSPLTEEGRYDDEGPLHEVTISTAFAVGVFEIWYSEWDACARDGGCDGYRPASHGWPRGFPGFAVRLVTWNDAQLYLRWLSEKTGHHYRLLSEAEWEYVARGGTTTPYNFGMVWDEYEYEEVIDGQPRSLPNAFGVRNANSNVMEWVEDMFHPSYEGAPTNGEVWIEGGVDRVVRGGKFGRGAISRSAMRGAFGEAFAGWFTGFRVARDLEPEVASAAP